MTLDPFATLVVVGLAIIGALVVLFFVFAIVNGAFGLGLLEKIGPRLSPDQRAELETALAGGPDAEIEKLVDRIMALPADDRAELRVLAEAMLANQLKVDNK